MGICIRQFVVVVVGLWFSTCVHICLHAVLIDDLHQQYCPTERHMVELAALLGEIALCCNVLIALTSALVQAWSLDEFVDDARFLTH